MTVLYSFSKKCYAAARLLSDGLSGWKDIDEAKMVAAVEDLPDVDWVPENLDPPLVLAARFGQVRIAQLLLRRGADPNRSPPGAPFKSALTEAIRGGHADMVRLLISHGASVDVTNPDVRADEDVPSNTLLYYSLIGHCEEGEMLSLLRRFSRVGRVAR